MPRKFPWDDDELLAQLTLDELIELLGNYSDNEGNDDGTDEDSGEPCLVRGEGDPGWYWGDEVLDDDER